MKKILLPALGVTGFFSILFYIVNLASPQNYPGCKPLLTRNYFDPSLTVAIWQSQNTSPLLGLKNAVSPDEQKVLGVQSQDKIIEISLSQKKLIAKKRDSVFLDTSINIGKFFPTPAGDFSVARKYLSADLSGGSVLNQTYFYLPNTPYSLYFHDNFALVGAYWSRSFGHESGFGCVELPVQQAEKLYYWADSPVVSTNPGTRVIISP